MNELQHRICRQVLDLKVRRASRDTAWRVQRRLSRLHRQQIVPLINQCCTELSPQHLHRIESLVIDLGDLSLGNLETDLLEVLRPRLRNALAENITEQVHRADMAGRSHRKQESSNELEMLAFFADTGNVPWWADSSRSNLVDISLGQLIRRAPRTLTTWIRALARHRSGSAGLSPSFPLRPSVLAGRGLRRIVLHCDDERLVELFSILESPSRRSLAVRRRQPLALLHACRAASGASSARFRGAAWRNALWLAVLQTACLDEAGSPGSEGFWREALARVAAELHTSYASLMVGLRQVLSPQARPQEESGPSSSEPLSPTQQSDISIPGLEEIWRVLILPTPRADADSKPGPVRGAMPNIETEGVSANLSPSETVSSAPLVLPEGSLEEIERILDRLRRGQGPLKSLFAALRSVAGRLPNRLRGQWWAILKDLEAPSPHEKFYASYRGQVRDARDFHLTRVRILLRLLAPLIERRLLALREDRNEQKLPGPLPVSLSPEIVRNSLVELEGLSASSLATEEVEELTSLLWKIENRGRITDEESFEEQTSQNPGANASHLHLAGKTKDRGPLSQCTKPTKEPPNSRTSGVRRSEVPGQQATPRLENKDSRIPRQKTSGHMSLEPTPESVDKGMMEAHKLAPDWADSEPTDVEKPTVQNHISQESLEQTDQKDIEQALQHLSQGAGLLTEIFTEIHGQVDHLSPSIRGKWSSILRERVSSTPHDAPTPFRANNLEATKELQPAPAATLLHLFRPLLEDRPSFHRESSRRGITLSSATVRRCLKALEGSHGAALPARDSKELATLLRQTTVRQDNVPASREESAPVAQGPAFLLPRRSREFGRTHFSETESVCVENSGLVILSPFLGHFFQRLNLMTERITPQSRTLQFRDQTARQRAVGLLQYLATEDPLPPEYQVTLGKVLCGMRMGEIFEPGDPVSSEEAEECTNLLSAVITQAPILKNMSIEGFRGTFLLRKGMLSSCDGAWLLRVEREAYDLVLDRFPWGVSWVKLPWMEALLRVEW